MMALPCAVSGQTAVAPDRDAAGGTAALRLVKNGLRGYAASLSERPLLASAGGFGTSLFADIAAAPSSGESGIAALVVAVPLRLSAQGEAARPDFGTGIGVLLAKKLAEDPAAAPVRIAFLADEASSLPRDLRKEGHAGLRDAADALEEASRSVIVYLDLPVDGSAPRLEYGTDEGIAPRYLVESMLGSFKDRGLQLPLAVPFTELYRLKLVSGRQELRLLRERRISSVLLENGGRGGAAPSPAAALSENDIAQAVADALRRLATTSQETDERYSLLSASSALLILPENVTVTAFIAVWGLFLLVFLGYSVTHRRLLVARWNVFLRRLWVVAGFLVVLGFCFIISGWTLSLAFHAMGASEAAGTNGAAALKLLIAFSLYYTFSPLFRFRIVPRRAHFYGSAAVMLLALGALTAAVLDFTFIPVFIWSFSLAFIASAISAPTLALIPTLLAPLQILGSAAAAVGSGDPKMAVAIMSGGISIDFYLAFLSLPFMFLFRRVSILSRAKTIRRTGQEFSAHAHRKFTRPILVAGALLAAVAFAKQSADASASRLAPTRTSGRDASLFSLDATSSTFLESRTIALRFKSADRPRRIDLKLISDEPLAVYDAPVPFILGEDGSSAAFTLGEDPPMPLTLEFTLPKTQRARFEATALYYDAENDRALALDADAEVGPETRP